MVNLTRSDIVLCDFNPVIGTEQSGIRPVDRLAAAFKAGLEAKPQK
jgi:hypothetical protein